MTEETGCTTLHVGHFIRIAFLAVVSVICFAHLTQDNQVLKVSAKRILSTLTVSVSKRLLNSSWCGRKDIMCR